MQGLQERQGSILDELWANIKRFWRMEGECVAFLQQIYDMMGTGSTKSRKPICLRKTLTKLYTDFKALLYSIRSISESLKREFKLFKLPPMPLRRHSR